MATYTANYRLKKPGLADYYNIQDFNDNADVIDGKLKLGEEAKSLAESLQTSQQGMQTTLNGLQVKAVISVGGPEHAGGFAAGGRQRRFFRHGGQFYGVAGCLDRLGQMAADLCLRWQKLQQGIFGGAYWPHYGGGCADFGGRALALYCQAGRGWAGPRGFYVG